MKDFKDWPVGAKIPKLLGLDTSRMTKWEMRADSPHDVRIEATYILDPLRLVDDEVVTELQSFRFFPETSAMAAVLAERQRQIDVEGWTPEHDDEHDIGELAIAAACYVTAAPEGFSDIVQWPWAAKWWKPGDPRRNLVKAGALILAEIERLDRAAAAERATQ